MGKNRVCLGNPPDLGFIKSRQGAPFQMIQQSQIAVQDQLISLVPVLRSFAYSLTHNRTYTDDLVQETVLRAWTNLARFEPGTNMRAWLFTILRNHFYSELRKKRRECEDVDGEMSARLWSAPNQDDCVALNAMYQALARLPEEQREAITLVAASGLSYEEAAKICSCAIGTIKSRVHRARAKLLDDVEHGRRNSVTGTLQAAAS